MLHHIIIEKGEPISGVKVIAANNEIIDYKPKFNLKKKKKSKYLHLII